MWNTEEQQQIMQNQSIDKRKAQNKSRADMGLRGTEHELERQTCIIYGLD